MRLPRPALLRPLLPRPFPVATALAATLVATPGAGQSPPPEQVTIELSSFRFTPATPVFRQGQPYRLHLVNASSGGHDFSAKAFFAASRIDPADKGKIADGTVSLHGGQSADITLVPERPGTYPLRCTHFMHSAFGMRGSITVQ